MTLIEAYINQAEPSHHAQLTEIYYMIKELVPMAEECISWGMPTFKVNGNLIHFADNKHHIGIYPGPTAVLKFATSLNDFKHSKGAIQFPYNKPLPKQLIKEIVLFRLEEQMAEIKR